MTDPQKNRCRFDAFVKLKPGIPSHYPGLKRTWCHRGDKFTDDERKMISNLVKLVNRKLGSYSLVEIYDNKLPKEDPRRLILKIHDGIIEKNDLPRYSRQIKGMILPEYLKSTVHENKTDQG